MINMSPLSPLLTGEELAVGVTQQGDFAADGEVSFEDQLSLLLAAFMGTSNAMPVSVPEEQATEFSARSSADQVQPSGDLLAGDAVPVATPTRSVTVQEAAFALVGATSTSDSVSEKPLLSPVPSPRPSDNVADQPISIAESKASQSVHGQQPMRVLLPNSQDHRLAPGPMQPVALPKASQQNLDRHQSKAFGSLSAIGMLGSQQALRPTHATQKTTDVKASGPADQIVDSILVRARLTRDDNRVVWQLHLDPPELGPVDIQLTATKEMIHAQLIVHHDQAWALLERHVQTIRQQLVHAGVQLGGFQLGHHETDSQGGRRWSHRFAARVFAGVAVSTQGERLAIGSPVPRGIIDLFV
ncbi:MAG: hypothetical protein KatS3mg105_0756 [Gemmatales bacterium]|nr:MAG: hypothetical protein KatS3mg105_0756 [Gemmatales bacterium]